MSVILKNIWIIHLLGWLLFLILPLTIVSREQAPDIQLRLLTSAGFWLFFAIYLVIFYGNTLFLFPQLFLKQHLTAYLIVFTIGLAAVFYTKPFENLIFSKFHAEQPHQGRPDRPEFGPPPGGERDFGRERPGPGPDHFGNEPVVDFVSLVLFIIVWVAATAIKTSEQWRLSERRAILSEADKAQAELSFFKAQINPHFLFNTLNNIYSLAVSNSVNTAPSIMKLSRMMRYITDEATENMVPLEDEITCLENYVDLQKLRLNAKTTVNFTCQGNFQSVRIAPLILMTFVENAFKYGVSNRFESLIQIRLETNDHTILFSCQNQVFETNIEDEREGIGIANTRKRLEFLYPDRHVLNLSRAENLYTVNLELGA